MSFQSLPECRDAALRRREAADELVRAQYPRAEKACE
jgi:hypothetical protein